ncbi:hypothetical protein ACM66B_004783 [Microbotryomycetes sp. NB124-2]
MFAKVSTTAAAVFITALLATPHVLATPQPGFFDRIGEAWDDLVHGGIEPTPIESLEPVVSASKLASEIQATLSAAAISQSSAAASKASSAAAKQQRPDRSRRASTGTVPESSFESDSESHVEIQVEQEEKRSLLDSISDTIDDLNPFTDDAEENAPLAEEWVQGDTIIRDYTPADGLPPSDENAILISDSYSILSTPSFTATLDLLKILPTSLSRDQLSSLAAAISSLQKSAASAATATTTGTKSTMTPPASSSSSKGKSNKVTIVVDAAMLETDFYGTPSPTTATVNARAKMTPGPVNLEAEAKISLASGGPPAPPVAQPIAIELDTEDDDLVSFLGPVTPPLPTPPASPVISPDQVVPVPPFGLEQVQVDIERRGILVQDNTVIIQDDTPGAATMPIRGKATPPAKGADLPRETVFPGPPDGPPGLNKDSKPVGQAEFSVDKGYGRPPHAGKPVGLPEAVPNDAAYDAPPTVARRHLEQGSHMQMRVKRRHVEEPFPAKRAAKARE